MRMLVKFLGGSVSEYASSSRDRRCAPVARRAAARRERRWLKLDTQQHIRDWEDEQHAIHAENLAFERETARAQDLEYMGLTLRDRASQTGQAEIYEFIDDGFDPQVAVELVHRFGSKSMYETRVRQRLAPKASKTMPYWYILDYWADVEAMENAYYDDEMPYPRSYEFDDSTREPSTLY